LTTGIMPVVTCAPTAAFKSSYQCGPGDIVCPLYIDRGSASRIPNPECRHICWLISPSCYM